MQESAALVAMHQVIQGYPRLVLVAIYQISIQQPVLDMLLPNFLQTAKFAIQLRPGYLHHLITIQEPHFPLQELIQVLHALIVIRKATPEFQLCVQVVT